jgi:hypothetical protein
MDDVKPKADEPVEKEAIGASVEEHPISEADTKKFAGVGDFSLPTKEKSLDGLMDEMKKEPVKAEVPAPMPQPQASKPSVSSSAQPAVKPVAQPMPIPTNGTAKDLEKKAQDMLKDLNKREKKADSPAGDKPKKRKGGAVTKMALAAVLMVMMGAGGIVGMNLLKMDQVADQRSQAGYNRNGNTGNCLSDSPVCCNESGCIVRDGYCFVTRYSCDSLSEGPNGCQSNPETFNVPGTVVSFNKDCGLEQIDAQCAGSDDRGWSSYWHDKDCSGDETTPAPTPVPTTQPMACTGLTKTPTGSLSIGETVTLGCSHSGQGKDRYEYQYKVEGDADWTSLGTTNTLVISKAGTYTAQCRVCKANDTCTAWGQAQ